MERAQRDGSTAVPAPPRPSTGSVEENEGKDGRARGVRSEDHLGYRDALRRTLLRAADDDGHSVGARHNPC
jgi:hypothetical protein